MPLLPELSAPVTVRVWVSPGTSGTVPLHTPLATGSVTGTPPVACAVTYNGVSLSSLTVPRTTSTATLVS